MFNLFMDFKFLVMLHSDAWTFIFYNVLQAEEAQRLRKKRRAEAQRILDMEMRQKQRLEEMRKTQQKVCYQYLLCICRSCYSTI